MEKLLRLFLSVFLILFFSCQSKEEKIKEATDYGFSFYQGQPQHMNAFAYAIELDSTNATNWRELSVTYLKRGIPSEWKKYYDKAVYHDAEEWQPWRGYLYLWFYRDYEKAIADFNASDTLTPDFIDAPQGQSVDYWRGVAYLGLEDYNNSIRYFDKHIEAETLQAGEEWVDQKAFLFRGISYYELKEYEQALINFDKVIKYSKDKTADANYYKALTLQKTGDIPAAMTHAEKALNAFNKGYYNQRPYVEEMRQIYIQELMALKDLLK
jgi:tetratricopeptide (TPR) repeat protein